MTSRLSAVAGALAAPVVIVLITPIPLAGQAPPAAPASASQAKTPWTAPRTPWGDPDLQGIYTSNDNVGVPIERPEHFGLRRLLTEQEFAERDKEAKRAALDDKADRRPLAADNTGDGPEHWYERGKTSRRTSLVVDPPNGRIPLTPTMRKRAKEWETQRFGKGVNSWLDFDLWDRCITKGMPTVMVPLGYNNSYEIFQAPGYIAILYEVIHDVRIIPLDGRPHVDQSVRQWLGASRGHWEGDTLVVDVTNVTEKTMGNQQPAGPYRGGSKSQHLIERFTRVGPDALEYKVTLEDPEAFTRPWTMDIPLVKDDSYQIFEYACHEGNLSMVHMLEGIRGTQDAAEPGAKKKSNR